ncbi:MAG: MFS transporter [Acidimicrobiia bacterium]
MTGPAGVPFRARSLASSIYAPIFLFSIGRGAVIPVIALLALDLGASPAVAGLVVAMRSLGTLVFDIPAGLLVARVGERRAMVVSGLALTVISVGIWLRPGLVVYTVLVVLVGCAWSVWMLARITYAAGSAPPAHRGRVMAMMGGIQRIGLLIGPLIGSVLVVNRGLTGPFLVLAVLSAGASVTVAVSRPRSFTPEPTSEAITVTRVLRDHWRSLSTAGLVAVTAQVLRSSREVLIPLWGDRVGIGAGSISLVFAASAAIESLMFYPVGMVMDRKGRKWTALPSITLLSLGIAAIPLTSSLTQLTALALVLGVGNGLGSGMNMTLGSDLSPLLGRSRFIGLWRVVTDVGTMGGPLLVAGVATLSSLAAAALSVGAVGVAGVWVLWRWVPETLERTR